MKVSITIGIISLVLCTAAMPTGEKEAPATTTKAPLAPPPSSSPKTLTSRVPDSSTSPKPAGTNETIIGSPEAIEVFNAFVNALNLYRKIISSALNIDLTAQEGSRAVSNSKPATSGGATGTGQYFGGNILQSIMNAFSLSTPAANKGSTGKQDTPKGKAPTQATFAKAASTLFNAFSEDGLIAHSFNHFG